MNLRGFWPQFAAMRSGQILQRRVKLRILRSPEAANSPLRGIKNAESPSGSPHFLFNVQPVSGLLLHRCRTVLLQCLPDVEAKCEAYYPVDHESPEVLAQQCLSEERLADLGGHYEH